MAIEIIENFTGFQTIFDVEPLYDLNDAGATNGTNLQIVHGAGPTLMPGGETSAPRNPPSVLRFKGLSNTSGGNATEFRIPTSSTQDKVIGFHYKPVAGEVSTTSDTRDIILACYDDTNFQMAINLEIYHSLEFFDPPVNEFPGGGVLFYLQYSTSTILFDSTGVEQSLGESAGLTMTDGGAFMEYGKWYYIELRIKAVAGATGEVELRVNGVSLYSEIRQTSVGQPNVGFVEFRSGETSGNASYGSGHAFDITDIAINDQTTGYDGWIYPAIVDTIKPTTEVVGEIDFTPQTGTDNAAMVDDVPHDYDTTWNESTTVGHKDRFSTTQTVPYTNQGSVLGVKVQAIMKDTADLGTRQARAVVFENATEGVGATVTLSKTGFQPVEDVFATNPDTTAAWTKAEVNACQFGYEVIT